MKILINKSVLESMLINTLPYLEKKDLSKISSHILITALEDELNIKSTDLEIGIEINSKNLKVIEMGNATANGKKLFDIVKILKDDDVTLETINDYLYIKQKNSKFKLPMFNPSEFPEFPKIDNKPRFDINSSQLVRSIKKIAPAIDTNNPKFELNGALIDIKEEYINIVATDTKRLALVKIENSSEKNISLIIPKKAITEIQKIFFDEIAIYYDENTLIAKSPNFTFFTKLINGKYPDYERIIPKDMDKKLLLSRDKFIEAIKQIWVVSQEIKITFKPEIIVFESLNESNIEAKTEIETNTGLEEDISLAVNSKHIIDFLTNIEKSSFSFGYNDSNLPFTLESENFITIIMPIMV
ncbi:MAG: DNA polymerase III subunit beta [Epsilonproteobacteria bacterium]|nr:DNA polymerase III subunit beta [Campylobacterota bacterium]